DGPSTVAGEEIPRADSEVRARRLVADAGRNTLGVLLEVDQLRVEPDPPRGERLGTRLQDRLQPDLREISLRAGAGGGPVQVQATGAPGLHAAELPPERRIRPREAEVVRAVTHVLRRSAALVDLRSDAQLGEDLHRALVQHVCLRQ